MAEGCLGEEPFEIDEFGDAEIRRRRLLQAAHDELSELENQRVHLASRSRELQNQLYGFYEPLGSAAFASIANGEVEFLPIASERMQVHQNIDEMNSKLAKLNSSDNLGLFEKTKLKGQQVALSGQLTFEKSKIRKLESRIGQWLIENGQQETVRTPGTAKLIDEVTNIKAELEAVAAQGKSNEIALEEKKANLASLGVENANNATELKYEMDKEESLLNGTVDVDTRSQMSDAEAQRAFQIAEKNMFEELSIDMEKHLKDFLLDGEELIYKIRSSQDGERSQAALTNKNLFVFSKGIFGGQMQDSGGGILGAVMARGRVSIRVYPLQTIEGIEIQPPKGITTGHFQVLTRFTAEHDNESMVLLDSNLGYFKGLLLYRKIRELQQG
jgi:hypothetical protein